MRDYLGTYGAAGPEEFARWFDLRPPLAKKAFASGPRSAVSRPPGWISPVLLVNGRIEGTWEPGPVVTTFREQPDRVEKAIGSLGS